MQAKNSVSAAGPVGPAALTDPDETLNEAS